MSHTKSCWLTLEAMDFASWTIVGGSAVISAARRPGAAQSTQPQSVFMDSWDICFSRTAHHIVFPRSILA